MASVESIIYNRLKNASNINTAVKGNILTEFRDDITPSLVIEVDIRNSDEGRRYEGIGAIRYEIKISVVGDSYPFAVETADLIVANLDNEKWTDNAYQVLGIWLDDRKTDYLEHASKNKRLAVCDLSFEAIINTAIN